MKWVMLGLVTGLVFGSGCSTVKGWFGGEDDEKQVDYSIPPASYESTFNSAAGGDEEAQFKLGEIYEKGIYKRDIDGKIVGMIMKSQFEQAYAWYSMAAANGHPAAKAKIGAAWKPRNIARGKELFEILKGQHPGAIQSSP